MEEKKNILFIVSSINNGFIENNILEICKRNYEYKDYNIFVLTSGGRILTRLTYYQATPIILDVNHQSIFKIFTNIFKITNIIKKYKIDLVQAESRSSAWSAYFACKKLKIPFITTINYIYKFKKGVRGYFNKLFNSSILKGDYIITYSEFAKYYYTENYKKYLHHRSNKDILVLNRGIDLELFNKNNLTQSRLMSSEKELLLPDDKFIILIPTFLMQYLDFKYIIEVLSLIKNKNFICLFVGSELNNSTLQKNITKLITKFDLSYHIKMSLNITDMPALYYMSNLIISVYINNIITFNKVAIEAQAMEKLFLGVNLNGTNEYVLNGKTGFIIDNFDKQHFADKIEFLLQLSQKEKENISATAREFIINNFNIENYYKELRNLYNYILK